MIFTKIVITIIQEITKIMIHVLQQNFDYEIASKIEKTSQFLNIKLAPF